MQIALQGLSVRMASVLAVARHEWRLLTSGRLIPVFQAGFLFSLSALIFLVADFYASDSASLDLLATFLPWVALIFVPALAMRLFSEENGDRQMEFLSTLPVSPLALVTGKWLAGTAVLLVTLALTFPFPLTVAYLGDLDIGRAMATYLGGALLLATLFAIALLAAAAWRDQIGAFVAALATLFIAIFIGSTSTSRLIYGEGASTVLEFLSAFSPKYWFDRIASGRIELSALLYFAVVTLLALRGAAALLSVRTEGVPGQREAIKSGGVAVVALLAAGLAISGMRQTGLSIDATDEREYSLHAATKKVISRIPEGTVVDLYWSNNVASVPAAIREHARRVNGLLEAIEARADGRLRVVTHAPESESDEELLALSDGVNLVPMTSGESFMLGATARAGDRQTRIGYFDISRDALTEYDIAQMLSGLGKSRVPRVAVLSPLVLPRQAKSGTPGLTVIEELQRAYDVAVVPSFSETLPEGLDALVVIDATILKPQMLCAIDQHVMQGKGLVVLTDPFVRSNRASNEVTPDPSAEINDVSDLLMHWGVRYNAGDVVGDASFGTPVANGAGRQFLYPFWLTVGPSGIASSERISAGLHALLFPEPGSFDLSAKAAVPLVTTSGMSGTLGRETFKSSTPEAQAARFRQDGRARVLAASLEGDLKSAFGASCDHNSEQVCKHIGTSSGARVYAVADIDWIFDDFAFQPSEGGSAARRVSTNDNTTFFLNLVEAAAGEDAALAGLRARGQTVRRFTRVEAIARAASKAHQAKIRELEVRIAGVEDAIAKIPAESSVRSLEQLPSGIKLRVAELRRDLLPLRKELRDLRRQARVDVESLGRRLTLANLAAGPVLVLAQAALFGGLRRRRQKIRKHVSGKMKRAADQNAAGTG
jgi:ABC-2 type transport system permease protein